MTDSWPKTWGLRSSKANSDRKVFVLIAVNGLARARGAHGPEAGQPTNACTLVLRLIVLVWLLIDCWRDLVTALKQCVSHRQWCKETVDPPDRHDDKSTEATSAKATQNRSDQPGGTTAGAPHASK
jgi:hypothetical protein